MTSIIFTHLVISYENYIVDLGQIHENEVQIRIYHPLILQETTFAVPYKVSPCMDQHLLEQSVISFPYSKEIIIKIIADGFWCNLKLHHVKSVKMYM